MPQIMPLVTLMLIHTWHEESTPREWKWIKKFELTCGIDKTFKLICLSQNGIYKSTQRSRKEYREIETYQTKYITMATLLCKLEGHAGESIKPMSEDYGMGMPIPNDNTHISFKNAPQT